MCPMTGNSSQLCSHAWILKVFKLITMIVVEVPLHYRFTSVYWDVEASLQNPISVEVEKCHKVCCTRRGKQNGCYGSNVRLRWCNVFCSYITFSCQWVGVFEALYIAFTTLHSGHSMNKVPLIQGIITKIKSIVTAVRKSPKLKNAFDVIQTQVYSRGTKVLINSNKTR